MKVFWLVVPLVLLSLVGCGGGGSPASSSNNTSATATITVSITGNGSGSVTSSPAGISCPGTCTATFNAGTLVTLTQTETGNSVFDGWGGACSGSVSCSLTLSAAQTVSAVFNAIPGVFGITYTAPVDTQARGYSPIQLPAANIPFTDPDYVHSGSGGICNSNKTCLIRATDLNTAAGIHAIDSNQPSNISFRTTSGSAANGWSVDDKYFVVTTSAGNRNVIMNFNAANGKVSVNQFVATGIGGGSGELHFSKTEPGIAYGYLSNGPNLAQINVATNPGVTKELYDVTACPGLSGLTAAGGGWDTSFDLNKDGKDDRYATFLGGGQNNAQYAVVWDRPSGACRWFDVFNNKTGGDTTWPGSPPNCTSCLPGTMPSNVGIHAIELSHNGRYMRIAVQGYGTVIWDIDATVLTHAAVQDPLGHAAWGMHTLITRNSGSGTVWDGFDGSAPTTTISEGPAFPPDSGYHNSWITVDHPNETKPMYVDTYPTDGNYQDNTKPGYEEVQMVAMDGSGTTYRFAHNRSDVSLDGQYFYHTPRGNVTRDGKFAIFTSNWDGTLGTDNGNYHRDDVFVVELR